MSFWEINKNKDSFFEISTGECLKIVSPTIIEEGKPELDAKLPLVRLVGSSDEIGAAHGSLLRERIEKTFELYRSKLFNHWTDSSLKATSLAFFERIKEFSRSYANELEAIASHSGRKLWEIAMIISRTELLRSTTPNECTALYFKNRGILGQNWDWIEDFENLAVIFDVTREDNHRFLALGEPSFMKIGLNNSGVGVCLNILKCDAPTGGIPVQLLLRKVLDSSSVHEAYCAIASANRATMSSILIADYAGKYVNLELAGKYLHMLQPNDVEINHVVAHTNGYLTSEKHKLLAPKETASSTARLNRVRTLILTSRTEDESDMLSILLDKEGLLPICRLSEQDSLDGQIYGTVSTIVMNLQKKELLFSRGNPHEATFSYASIA